MKTKKLTLALATFLLTSAAFVSSCKKKTADPPPDKDTAAASDNSMAETTSNDAVNMAGQASENGSLSSYRNGPDAHVSALSCASVTVNPITKIITATFNGSSACMDGHYRSGTITFDYSQGTGVFYRNPGFKCVITTQNYMVDGNSVTLNKTIINTTPAGFNPSTTNMTWSLTGSVTIVKINNGGTVTWNCTRTKTLMNTGAITYNGLAVPAAYIDQNTMINWGVAVVSVSGTANGTTTKGEAYNFTITNPLVLNMNCTPDNAHPGRHPIVQGTFDFTPGSRATRHVDYGNGSCDLNATVTIDGIVYNITLP